MKITDHDPVDGRRRSPWTVRLCRAVAMTTAVVMLSTATFASTAQAQSVQRPTSCSFARFGDSVQINFTTLASDGAARYVLQQKVGNGPWRWGGKIEATSSSRTFIKDGIDRNATVRFRVFARDGDIKSPMRWCGSRWQSQARWSFNGNLQDSVGGRTAVAGVPGRHAGDIELLGSRVKFNGNPGSIVIAAVDGADGRFNPDGSSLRWVTRLKMSTDNVNLIIAQHEQALADRDPANGVPTDEQRPIPSWNVVQRGFANNAGGQWKTQIVVKGVGGGEFAAFAECIVRDGPGAGRFIKQRSSVPIAGGSIHTVVCEFDDAADELEITFDNASEAAPATPSVADFGDVTPSGSTECATGGANKLGDSITIGNKPACGTIDPEDSFIGTIYKVEIAKR